MSDSIINAVNPYSSLVDQYVNGLDAIITSIGTGGKETVTIDDLTDAVYDYIVTVYTDYAAGPEGVASVQAMIANAINGYVDNGGSSPYLGRLLTVPANNLEYLFSRMAESSRAASRLKGSAGQQQMVLAMGEASTYYWRNQIDTTGSWIAYMSGNAAIDTASLPYWADAAMFGASFDYNQVNGTDAQATTKIFPATLIGALAVSACKVVFGLVPKNVGAANEPVIVSEDCDCSGGAKRMSGELSQIGRPIGGVGKANTNWHQPGTGKFGTDFRYYKNKHPCLSLHNYFEGGKERMIGGDDCY